jgi:hypothetical protein
MKNKKTRNEILPTNNPELWAVAEYLREMGVEIRLGYAGAIPMCRFTLAGCSFRIYTYWDNESTETCVCGVRCKIVFPDGSEKLRIARGFQPEQLRLFHRGAEQPKLTNDLEGWMNDNLFIASDFLNVV